MPFPHARTLLLAVTILAALTFCCGLASAAADKPPVSRVLIVGDAVYQQYARGAHSELKNQASVKIAKWPKYVHPSSSNALAHLGQLLGYQDGNGNDVPEDRKPRWDLIHLNVGLGDLIHTVPNLKGQHRVMPHNLGGVVLTPPGQYENNLRELIRQLRAKAPDATIVWASTTPIRASLYKVFKPGMAVEYNRIAAKVMDEYHVPINDMHAYVRSLIDMDKPAGRGLDPFFFDKKPLHPPIVDVIVSQLGLAPIERKADQTAR